MITVTLDSIVKPLPYFYHLWMVSKKLTDSVHTAEIRNFRILIKSGSISFIREQISVWDV